tara:strand:- start:285 stop:635 length:351 start_codon:yes stop_codon:yes gene_type:complete
MNLLATLRTNWRDLVIGLGLVLACSFGADSIERWTLLESGQTWANNTVMAFRGLAAFGAANLAAFFVMSFAWPLINKFSNESFKDAWDHLPQWGRFTTLVAVSIAYLLAASICFAG